MLEYLEDIIGSNKYEEKIKELESEYEKLQEQKREKGQRMNITEADLEKLQDSKNMAIEFIRKEKQIYQINNVLTQINRFKAN